MNCAHVARNNSRHSPFASTFNNLPASIFPFIRPHQLLKNGFVLAGVLFAFKSATSSEWLDALYAFAAFCFASSTAYVVNDFEGNLRLQLGRQARHRRRQASEWH